MRDRYMITDQFEVHFLTMTVVYWVDLFTRLEYKQIIADSLNHCVAKKGLIVYGWVLMSNHLHLIVRTEEPHTMTSFLRDFKKFTSKALVDEILTIEESRSKWILDKFNFEANRTHRAEQFKLWQDGSHAVIMDNPAMLQQRLKHLHDNPVRHGVVEEPENYLYSSAVDYAGRKGLVKVEVV